MDDLRHIVVYDNYDDDAAAYHSGEPEKLIGERDGYCGGFSHDISDAIAHENIIIAKIACSRMAKIYNDVGGKWSVKTMTAKELFKARLGG